MKQTFGAWAIVVGLMVWGGSACYRDPVAPGPQVDSTVVQSSTALTSTDSSATYEYDFSAVRPDSVLLALYADDLPLVQAWLPLQYLCEDLIGPRLTVQLEVPRDAAMGAHDFRRGTGRLQCSVDLRRYVVVP